MRCAYGDADVVGPDGPGASDVYVLLAHGRDDLTAGAAGVDHEAVGDRGDVLVALAVEPREGGVARVGDDLAARWDEPRLLEAGACGGDSCYRQRVHAVDHQLLEQVGTAQHDAAADAGHAVDLGEGAQDDEVLAGGDLVDDRRRVGDVDVGFVDEEDGAGGLVI